MNRRTRTSIIASVAVICVAALAACALGAGSGNKLPEIPAAEAESNGVEVVVTGDDSTDAQADPAYLNDIDADALTQGLEFETLSVSGRGSVHTRLTNIASPYTVTATDVFWVSDENGGSIRFSGVPLLSQLRTLGFGDSLYYGFEVGELDADMKPGNYFINTNVFISTGGGEPVVQTVSVLFTYREPLTAITPEDAENYAQNYVDALNSGEDLAENSGGIESWHKWLGTDNPRFWVQSKSVKSSGRGGDYEFKVDSVVGGGDAIYTVTVNITLDSNAVYYSEPRYFCVFSQYYTLADALARDYVAALANNDVNALASVIAYDGTKQPDSAAKLGEAQRSIDYYSARYDIASLELSGGLMYGDDRQLFQQVVHDKNGDGFVLNIVYDRGLVSVEPPEQ